MNISHLKTLFMQEYEMNQSAKELFEWMEKQTQPEPQSKNDAPYWVIENIFDGVIKYLNIDKRKWFTNIHKSTKFNTDSEAYKILRCQWKGQISEHLGISEPMKESKCDCCNGTGKIESERPDVDFESCYTCNGKGVFLPEPMKKCENKIQYIINQIEAPITLEYLNEMGTLGMELVYISSFYIENTHKLSVIFKKQL